MKKNVLASIIIAFSLVSVIAFSLVAIIASVTYIITQKTIPGLIPLSGAASLFSLVYFMKQLFKDGKISKSYWNLILVVGIIGTGANIIAGIIQIINFM